jgi:hypothetical protein
MVWLNVLWGMFGAIAMDGLDCAATLKRTHRFPWIDPAGVERPWLKEYLAAIIINLLAGSGTAVAMGETAPHGISAWIAIGLGAGGSATLEKAIGKVTLDQPPPTPSPGATSQLTRDDAAWERIANLPRPTAGDSTDIQGSTSPAVADAATVSEAEEAD